MHHGDDRRTMPMTADDIVVHPALEPCVRAQAQSPLSIQEVSPRIASLFATQQRWLMAHAALAQYFRNEAAAVGTGLLAEHFLELVERHELASRNTASALLKEMLKYHIVRFGANGEGRRYRPLEPAPAVLMVPLARAASCDPRRARRRRESSTLACPAGFARRDPAPDRRWPDRLGRGSNRRGPSRCSPGSTRVAS